MLARVLLVASICAAAAPARAASDMYDLQVSDAKAAAGAKGSTSVTISGKNGWHVNEEAPISMKLTPAAGLAVDKPRLGKGDLAERSKDRARFDVGFTAAEAGRKTIDAEATFVMCQATACKPVKEKLVLAIDVAPAASTKPKTKK